MTAVECYVDPSCPWAWITSRWLTEVSIERDIEVTWESFCLEIRDEYGVAATVPESRREQVMAAHAVSHRMLRVFEAVRAEHGEAMIDRLYLEWGRRFFVSDAALGGNELLTESVTACGLDRSVAEASNVEEWDAPIAASMDVAYSFAGEKCQTPVIVIRSDPPSGFKGPVMSPAPTGEAALRMWDALATLSSESGFFEVTRPRANPPRAPRSDRSP